MGLNGNGNGAHEAGNGAGDPLSDHASYDPRDTELVPNEPDAKEHPLTWWLKCHLTTTLSEPRCHELTVPSGARFTLSVEQMLNSAKIRTRMLDAIGELPPLPPRNAADFLREVWADLFRKRTTLTEVAEASAAGALSADIQMILRNAPETDDPADLERGAIGLRENDGARLFNGRVILERTRRVCPVSFVPADFYAALRRLGCESFDSTRWGGWRGRAWIAPTRLFQVAPELPATESGTIRTAPPPDLDPAIDDWNAG